MNQPALYVTVNDAQRQNVGDAADEFVNEIGRMSGCCIDIGSGPGDVVVDLILPKLNPGATVVCSDISEVMIEHGKKKYGNNHRLSYIKLNIESPDLPGVLREQYDHATSFYCLHWCQDLRRVFKNIIDLLRPGGTIFSVFLGYLPFVDAYKALAAMPCYQPYMKDVDRYIPPFQYAKRPREALKALLTDVGFEVHHCSLREKSFIFDTPDALGKFMLAVNPFIDRIPADLREAYKKDLVKEAARTTIAFNKNNNNDDDYSILLTNHSFIVYLSKPATK